MQDSPERAPRPTKKHRRIYLVACSGDAEWKVSAEGERETHAFASRDLAVAYAGLWASSNAPSQLIERAPCGAVTTLREYD